MRIVDETLLDEFRGRRVCEWCRQRTHVEPHHLFTRGMGGGGRLDVRCNLIALCRLCHDLTHWGKIAPGDLLCKVAAREGTMVQAIVDEIHALRRRPREDKRH